jgi:tetratricopeptide (TPR) repeat protein
MNIIRKIWQTIKNFFLGLFCQKPPVKSSLNNQHHDTDYEAIFMKILDGVYQGWNKKKIKDLLEEKQINELQLNQWIEKFGERLISSPTLHQELAERMVQLNEVYLGEMGKIAANIGRQLLTQKPEETTIYLQIANEKFNEENWQEAIKDYDKILTLKPEHQQALLNKGICLDELGEKQTALECFDKIITIDKNNYQAWYNKGITLGSMEKIAEAIACFEEVIKLQPENYQAWFNKAVGLAKLNNLNEAIKAFAKMVEIKPDSYQGWFNYGLALEKLDRKEDAINCYDQAIKIKPDYQEAIEKKRSLRSQTGEK